VKKVILVISSILLFVGCGAKKAQVQLKGDVQAQSSYTEIGAPTEVYIEKPSSSYSYSDGSYQNVINEENVIYEEDVIYENTYTEEGRPVYDTGFYDEYEEKIKKNKKKKKRATKRVRKKSTIKVNKKRKVVKPVKKEKTIFIEKKKSRSTIIN